MLAPYLSEPPAAGPPDAVLDRMVADRVLTKYQAKRLVSGKPKGFFLGGKYKLLDHLGSGGMGHVYLCEHLLLQRLVAVKVLHPFQTASDTGATERFVREARAVAQLDHPNIARVFDLDCVGNTPFMVMEYIDGNDLHSIVSLRGPLTVARAGHYAYQAACGLAHAHTAGLVHRDIKPGNLLLDRGGTLKILDLGLARFFGNTARNGNITAIYDGRRIIGTADFMAPEQTVDSSAVDIRADVYSLGCTLYFMLTGRSPFEEGNITQKLLWHQLRAPRPVAEFRSDVPPDLLAVLSRMVAKEPNDRFQSPAEVVEALAGYAKPLPGPAVDDMPPQSAASYLLGLTQPPVATGDTSVTMKVFPDSQPAADTQAANNSETRPLSDAPATVSRSSSVRRWLVFGTVQLLVLGLGVLASWLINRSAKVPTSTGPARPAAVAAEPPFTLAGGGSTFVQKAMSEWTALYEPVGGGKISYTGGGSGKGVDGVLDRTLDFACTDAYLTPEQLARGRAAGLDLIHIPLVHGAVVPTYNLRDIRHGVRFSGPLLAAIYLGQVRKWNDPWLQRENPQVVLPDVAITVVYRSDSSGSTNIWTDFLRKTSGDWRAGMGDAATNSPKKWPVGVGTAGSEGVAELVNATYGAIGYVELTHSLGQPKSSVGLVRNREGFYVQPTLESVRAAATAELKKQFPKDFQFGLTDGPGADTYPVAGTMWAVFDAAGPDADKRKRILDFLDWVTHAGQAPVTLIYYTPLPDEIVQLVEAKLQRLRTVK